MNISEIDDRVKALFDESIKVTRRIPDVDDDFYVYDNQIETAKEIIYNFYTKFSRWNLLFAEMQSGKSGTFFSIPYIISKNKVLMNKMKIDMFDGEINVFLLTGMNEKELISQFEKDIYGFLGRDLTKNVLHNSEMRKILSTDEKYWSFGDLNIINRMRKNSLILIDESHYGSDKEQILDKFLRKVLDINPNGDNTNLDKNNIFVVSISATPMAEFINANISEYKKKIVPLRNSNGYWGIVDMFKNNKIFDSYDLKCQNSIDSFIDKVLNNKIGYTLVRCSEKHQKLILDRIGKRMISNISVIKYDQWERANKLNNQGINDILTKKPVQNTIVFLKGLLRAGKRVDTRNVVMVHDTLKSNTDTTVQSLLGRCCGYGKNKDIDIYCDRLSAEMFRDWVESDFSIENVPSKAKNVRGKSNVSISKVSDPILIDLSNRIDIVNKINSNKKSISDKIEILRLIKNDIINNNLNKEFEVGSIFRVSRNKKNTSYKKQYLDVLENNIYFGDYKPNESEVGKIIFSGSFNIDENKLIIMIGEVIKNEISSSDKSMYHETNKV